MTVDYFLCVGIQVDEHAEDELPGGDGVSLRTCGATVDSLLCWLEEHCLVNNISTSWNSIVRRSGSVGVTQTYG
jgi:hypothetical protein